MRKHGPFKCFSCGKEVYLERTLNDGQWWECKSCGHQVCHEDLIEEYAKALGIAVEALEVIASDGGEIEVKMALEALEKIKGKAE